MADSTLVCGTLRFTTTGLWAFLSEQFFFSFSSINFSFISAYKQQSKQVFSNKQL